MSRGKGKSKTYVNCSKVIFLELFYFLLNVLPDEVGKIAILIKKISGIPCIINIGYGRLV
ncbi:MAG: hypothetical protein H6Q74_1867 [Firmicutes bacterium]|nr:hypothetical protein [Bacillota bacterium]